MNRNITAIAVLTLRNAVRSKVVTLLIFGVLAAVIGVPLALRSDGTATGYLQLLLYYALGLAGIILSLAAVWSGAGAVALDIENRRAALLLCKPVHAWQLWLGKWLGLLVLNAVLVGVAGLFTGLSVAWHVRDSAAWPEAERRRLADEALVARNEIMPEPEDVSSQLAMQVVELRKTGELPEGPIPSETLTSLRRGLLRAAATIAPGGRKEWIFRLASTPDPNRPITLKFRFDGADNLEPGLEALWEIYDADGMPVFKWQAQYASGAAYSINLPPELAAVSGGSLKIVYGNIEPVGAPTVIFPPDGISLQVYAGAFFPNYLRALLIVFCRLAVLSALALTMGCCFSFPVASFVTFSLLLFSSFENWAALPIDSSALFLGAGLREFSIVKYLLAGLDMIIAPLYKLAPLSRLSEGLLVSASFTIKAVLITAIYSMALLTAGSVVFRRRELGLFT